MYIMDDKNKQIISINDKGNSIYTENGGLDFAKYIAKCIEDYPTYYNHKKEMENIEYRKRIFIKLLLKDVEFKEVVKRERKLKDKEKCIVNLLAKKFSKS